MSNPWMDLMTAEELAARTAETAKLDPAFAARDKAFYESRTAGDLRSLATQAWNCSQSEGYQVARSYLALKEV